MTATRPCTHGMPSAASCIVCMDEGNIAPDLVAEVRRLRDYADASRAWDEAMRSVSMTPAEKDRACVAWRTARGELDRWEAGRG